MRIPFFGSRGPRGPLRVPLDETLGHIYFVYFRAQGAVPDPEALSPWVDHWVQTRLQEPLLNMVTYMRSQGELMRVQIEDRQEVPSPPDDFIRMHNPPEELERAYAAATHVVVVTSMEPVMPPFPGLFAALYTAHALAEASGGVVLDPLRMKLLEPPPPGRLEWEFRVQDHIMLPHSLNNRGVGWMTSKGMSRFGLPELELEQIPPNLTEGCWPILNAVGVQLIRRLDQLQREREEPARELVLEPEMRLNYQDVALAGSWDDPDEPPPGARGWTMIGLEYRPGRRGEDSFLRLRPPAAFKGSHGVWVNSVRTDLVGTQDTLRNVKSDDEAMEAAHYRAVAELPQVRERFAAGLPLGAQLMVKHGFPTSGDHHEYMWLSVNTWKGDRIRGQLANDPHYRLDLRPGQTIDLTEADVYDWVILYSDGRTEGGYTNVVADQA